jgi:hypothetical protein
MCDIVRLSNLDTKISRGFNGTTFVGSDGNLYVYRYVYIASWIWWPGLQPITNPDVWPTLWTRITDNLTDGPITVFNGIPQHSGWASNLDMKITDDYLYILQWGSPNSPLKKYDKDTYDLLALNPSTFYGKKFVIYGGYIYTMGSFTGANIEKYDADTLVLISSVNLVGIGFSLTIVGGYIIVFTGAYSTVGSMYKIDPDTLAIVDQLSFVPGDSYGQACITLTDKFVATGDNNGISVFDIDNMVLVDSVFCPGGYNSIELVKLDI